MTTYPSTHRKPVTVCAVRGVALTDHRHSLEIEVVTEQGVTQEFSISGVSLKQQHAALQKVCTAFGVDSAEKLIGSKGFALYSFGDLDSTVEGLEAPSGRRFTITEFRHRYLPGPCMDNLFRAKAETMESIHALKRQMQRLIDHYNALDDAFIDWEIPAVEEV